MSCDDKKRQFLKWFLQHHQLKDKESLWILHYLLNHDFLLSRIHFIQEASDYPNGLVMATEDMKDSDFYFYHQGKVSKNPEEAFQAIRCNWRDDYYIELRFPDVDAAYLYFDLFDQGQAEEEEIQATFKELMDEMRRDQEIKKVRTAIDQALEKNDFLTLEKLSARLKELKGGYNNAN